MCLTALRLALSGVAGYQQELASLIANKVGLPVQIGRVHAKMRGFDPQLILEQITFGNIPDHPVIELAEIRVGVQLSALLTHRDWLSATWVSLVGCKLSVARNSDGSVAIDGLKATGSDPVWLLQGSKYELLHSEITWRDAQHPSAPAVTVKNVDMVIFNQGNRHRINVLLPLDNSSPQGQPLRASIVINGNFFQPGAVDGDIFVEANQLDLPHWLTGYLPADVTLQSGLASGRAWLTLQHSQLAAVQGELDLQQLHALRQGVGVVPVTSLKTRLQWARQANWQRLSLADLQWTDTSNKPHQARLAIGAEQSPQGQWQKLAASLSQLDLQVASGLAAFLPDVPIKLLDSLKQAQIAGNVQKLRVFADLSTHRFALDAAVSGLAMAALPGAPGFAGLSGQVIGTEQQGLIDVSLANNNVTLPSWFPQALPVGHFHSRVHWQQKDRQWRFASNLFEFALPGFTSQSQFSLSVPDQGAAPSMDLAMSFASDDVSKLAAYLPKKVMKPQDYEWFYNAFPAGKGKQGSLVFKGRLDKFPENPADGVFRLSVDVEQLQLNYAPNWPMLTGISGNVRIDNKVLTCDVTAATSHHLQLTKAVVVNPNILASKQLTVKGALDGAIGDVFSFLQASELKASTDKFVTALSPKGNTHIDADFVIPLGGVGKPKVRLNAKLNGAAVNVLPLDLWLERIVGDLKFTETGMSSGPIRAQVLGQPATITFSNPLPASILISADGTAAIDRLQQQFKLPDGHWAQGDLPYHLQFLLPDEATGKSDDNPAKVTIHSDLQGVLLDLPGGLAKTSQQKRPLSLQFLLDDAAELPVMLNYDQQLKAAVKFAMPQRELQSGHIVLGQGEAVQRKTAGLWLDINQTTLPVDDWLAVIGTNSKPDLQDGTPAKDTDISGLLRRVSIHTQDLQWHGSSLGSFDMALQPHQRHWSANFDSELAAGIAIVPKHFGGGEKISLDLAELDVSKLKNLQTRADAGQGGLTGNTAPAKPPEQLPLISVRSAKTLWQGIDIGSLSVETEHLDNGLAFKKIDLMGIRLQLSLSGAWTASKGQHQTQLQGHLRTANAGQLLADLNISKDLAETVANVDFSLQWPAPLYDFSYKNLRGTLAMHCQDGRILSVEPGFGRILGILALNQWVKRLQLDFSDVYKQGLTFDRIDGHFNFAKGHAHTQNLQVNAVPATIKLSGDLDLVNQVMDYEIAVVPKSADAVPIAGTIVGKFSALVAQGLSGNQQEGLFFGSHYQVKGKWSNLVIVPLREKDGLFQKTWSGITTFPWLGNTYKNNNRQE